MTFPTKILMWPQIIRPALIAAVLFMLITGLLYPLLTVLAGQTLFPFQAQGSVITRDGETLGSALIGQNFTQPYYFHSRPSMTQMTDPNDPSSTISHPYNAALSAASNHGPTSKKPLSAVQDRVQDYRKLNGLSANTAVPVDAVTASASGLDPHISLANAYLQAQRVRVNRGMSQEQILAVVKAHSVPRTLGLFGEPRINVLQLNIALDEQFKPVLSTTKLHENNHEE